jgi:hypothetical protein
MLNLCGIVVAILKMATGRNFSMSGHHYVPTSQILMISDNVDFLRYFNAILKMATDRHFSMSGINSGHHYLPTYQLLMISDNVEFLRYCGGHFENGDR